MIHRALTRIALGLTGAFALTVAVPTSACDCDGRPKVAATTENAPAAAAGGDGAKDSEPCTCHEATVPSAQSEASAAAPRPTLELQVRWTEPQGDGC